MLRSDVPTDADSLSPFVARHRSGGSGSAVMVQMVIVVTGVDRD